MPRQGANAPAAEEDGPADLPPRAWKEVLLATWKEAADDDLELVSAGVAFYAFLAFVPLLTAFVLSYGLIAEPSSVVGHIGTLTDVMPENAAQIIGDQLRSMTEGDSTGKGLGLLVAVAVALYGASKGATSIITALNIAYDVDDRRGFVGKTLTAFALTAGAVVSLFVAILAISAMNFLEALMPDLSGFGQTLITILFWAGAAASVALVLAVVYRYGPNRPDAPWRWITPGSAAATLVWLAATAGFGFYVSNFGSYNATYGSLGAVIVFLTWLYLTAYIVLLGAELNSELERRAAQAQRPPAPAPAAANAPAAATPGAGEVVWKSAAFGLLLALLGRPRRARTAR